MSNLVAIVAPSGSGKSTSIFPNKELEIEGLDPKETILINISGKPLPVKGGNSLYPIGKISEGAKQIITSDASAICQILDHVDNKMPEIKNIVIDDSQYLQGFTFMSKAKEKGYDKFSEIADVGFRPVKKASECKRNDLCIFFIYHEEVDRSGNKKIKTAGQMIDNVITMEGMFTVVLFGQVTKDMIAKKVSYTFTTNTDGTTTAKSPAGMFKEVNIKNDLGYVRKQMMEYYN